MASLPNLLRPLRTLLPAVGIAALILHLMKTGHLAPPTKGTIQIEYGAYSRDFEGLQVEIDGRNAGVLKAFGSASRCGFLVNEGLHVVRLVHPKMDSEPEKVQVYAGSPVLLMLQVNETGGYGGGPRAELAFQQ